MNRPSRTSSQPLSSEPVPTIAIFDADAPGALCFTRSLGRVGLKTRVYSHKRFPVARFSRYCTEFERCPDPEDARVFLPWLTAQLRAGRIQLIAPTSDLIAFYTAECAELFPRGLASMLPSREQVLTSLFKDQFDQACVAAGYKVPKTWAPKSVEEARALADSLPYPVVMKPKSHVAVGLERGKVLHSAADLRARYAAYPVPPEQAQFAERYPELLLPILQEYVPRSLENLYSVSGLIGTDGTIVAASASRKTRQWPPTLGVGIEFLPHHDPQMVEQGAALSKAVLGRGIFELELIRDPRSGELLAIDLNPRAHGFISFDVQRGHDLPLLWYRSVTGEQLANVGPARDDLTWTHAVPYHVSHWAGVLRGPDRGNQLKAYSERLFEQRVDIVNDWSDPVPSAPFLAYMLRHPGGVVRPFLKAPGEDAK